MSNWYDIHGISESLRKNVIIGFLALLISTLGAAVYVIQDLQREVKDIIIEHSVKEQRQAEKYHILYEELGKLKAEVSNYKAQIDFFTRKKSRR